MHVCFWIPNWSIWRLKRVLEVITVGRILTSNWERKGLALATCTFVRYYKIKWWKPPVKPLRHKSFLTSWSSWPYAGRTMILCAMTNQWCTEFIFLAIHPHLVPSVDNLWKFTSQKEAFPIALKTPVPSKWERRQRIPIIPGHAWSGHGHIFAICFPSPNCCNCYAIFGNGMWNSVRLVDKQKKTRETWCANDLVTFSRPKDIALYQLDLCFFWILLVCFSWSFRI